MGTPRRRDRRGPLLGHEPALGRRLARVHLHRRLADERLRRSATARFGDYLFKIVFIWISIGVAIASLRYGKWIPNLGAFLRFGTLGFFSITVVVYGAKHGFHGFSGHDASPTKAVFIGLVPVLLFNYVGFELQNGAAEEMENPQRDVPISVFQSAVLGVFSYVIPILGILLVLPLAKVTGIGGFIDAVTEVFTVYGGAAHTLLVLMTLGFVGSLVTSGAVWMIGSDRVQAVAAYDGAFFPLLRRLQPQARDAGARERPVGHRLDGLLRRGGRVLQQRRRLDVPGRARHRDLDDAPLVHHDLPGDPEAPLLATATCTGPYTFPFGKLGVWVGTVVVTFFVLLGSWVAVFPDTIEKVIGVDYGSFKDAWGVSRLKFEAYTLGTLGVIVLIAVIGYIAGAPTRRASTTVPI